MISIWNVGLVCAGIVTGTLIRWRFYDYNNPNSFDKMTDTVYTAVYVFCCCWLITKIETIIKDYRDFSDKGYDKM